MDKIDKGQSIEVVCLFTRGLTHQTHEHHANDDTNDLNIRIDLLGDHVMWANGIRLVAIGEGSFLETTNVTDRKYKICFRKHTCVQWK